MKRMMVVLGMLLAVGCASGARVVRQNASGHIDPAERDRAFSSALRVVQQGGWLIAVSDRSAGLLTSQSMSTGAKECGRSGMFTCSSRGALQITIAESGDVMVNLHRELLSPIDHEWFVPTLESDVSAIEAEQTTILNAILGRPQ